MFSSGHKKQGWFKRYLINLSEKRPSTTTLSIKTRDVTAYSLDSLRGMLYEKTNANGLLLGCPVLLENLSEQAVKFGFPDKMDKTLLVYLDTLFKTGMDLIWDSDSFHKKNFLLKETLEFDQYHERIYLMIQYVIQYHLPQSYFRIKKEESLPEMLRQNEILSGALLKFEKVLQKNITLRGYSSRGSRQKLFTFLQLYCCLDWIRSITVGNPKSIDSMLQKEFKYRKDLILAFASVIWADGKVTHVEQNVIRKYIEQSGLSEEVRFELKKRVRQPVGMHQFNLSFTSEVLKHYLLKQLILFSQINRQNTLQEEHLIEKIALKLGFVEDEIASIFLNTANFFKKHTHQISFLRENPSTRQFQDYIFDKVKLRFKTNLDRIMKEIKETRELYDLLKKATQSPLNDEEREKIRLQLIDIAKSIPALAIFALPGGGLLLPILIKVLPFKIMPSAFTKETQSTP